MSYIVEDTLFETEIYNQEIYAGGISYSYSVFDLGPSYEKSGTAHAHTFANTCHAM